MNLDGTMIDERRQQAYEQMGVSYKFAYGNFG